jgi:ribonuclease HII
MNLLKQFDIDLLSNEVRNIAGIDEAGRGPLAGPVVAAAVIFDKGTFIDGVYDSKKIREKDRVRLAEKIKEKAVAYSYGIVGQQKIDEINILQATLQAMKKAVTSLSVIPDLIIIDGNKIFNSDIPAISIIKGDSKSFSIGAASILAKVKRDEIMKKASLVYPQYAWEKNKGYGTKEHIQSIQQHGYTELHRKTFLRNILAPEIQEELI